jgi:uncharacterized protein (TIGR03905 family)
MLSAVNINKIKTRSKKMKFYYKTKGICARTIEVELNDEKIIESASFEGGCGGNTQGVARLVTGMSAENAIEKLKGINCGSKGTSCPDQLSDALAQAVAAMEPEPVIKQEVPGNDKL